MRQCCRCHTSKSENEFTKRTAGVDGLNAACSTCVSIRFKNPIKKIDETESYLRKSEITLKNSPLYPGSNVRVNGLYYKIGDRFVFAWRNEEWVKNSWDLCVLQNEMKLREL